MIQQTYDRISKIIPKENIFVITNKEYVAVSHQQFRKFLKKILWENLDEEYSSL
jgi:mannose-1-phosphate guanylyltransferase